MMCGDSHGAAFFNPALPSTFECKFTNDKNSKNVVTTAGKVVFESGDYGVACPSPAFIKEKSSYTLAIAYNDADGAHTIAFKGSKAQQFNVLKFDVVWTGASFTKEGIIVGVAGLTSGQKYLCLFTQVDNKYLQRQALAKHVAGDDNSLNCGAQPVGFPIYGNVSKVRRAPQPPRASESVELIPLAIFVYGYVHAHMHASCTYRTFLSSRQRGLFFASLRMLGKPDHSMSRLWCVCIKYLPPPCAKPCECAHVMGPCCAAHRCCIRVLCCCTQVYLGLLIIGSGGDVVAYGGPGKSTGVISLPACLNNVVDGTESDLGCGGACTAKCGTMPDLKARPFEALRKA